MQELMFLYERSYMEKITCEKFNSPMGKTQ